MRKTLLLLFSLFIVGCSTQPKIKYIHTKCPTVPVKPVAINEFNFSIRKKDDKIIISKKDFAKLIHNYIYMKHLLRSQNKQIQEFNKFVERVNNEH